MGAPECVGVGKVKKYPLSSALRGSFMLASFPFEMQVLRPGLSATHSLAPVSNIRHLVHLCATQGLEH